MGDPESRSSHTYIFQLSPSFSGLAVQGSPVESILQRTVMRACGLEKEARGSQVQSQPGLHSEIGRRGGREEKLVPLSPNSKVSNAPTTISHEVLTLKLCASLSVLPAPRTQGRTELPTG